MWLQSLGRPAEELLFLSFNFFKALSCGSCGFVLDLFCVALGPRTPLGLLYTRSCWFVLRINRVLKGPRRSHEGSYQALVYAVFPDVLRATGTVLANPTMLQCHMKAAFRKKMKRPVPMSCLVLDEFLHVRYQKCR